MFCVNCGTRLDNEALFCPNCGMRQERPGLEAQTPGSAVPWPETAQAPIPEPPRKKGRGLAAGLIAAAVVVALGAGGFGLWKSGIVSLPFGEKQEETEDREAASKERREKEEEAEEPEEREEASSEEKSETGAGKVGKKERTAYDEAEQALRAGDYASAMTMLEGISNPVDEERYRCLSLAAGLMPRTESVDTGDLSRITATVAYEGDWSRDFTVLVTDNGAPVEAEVEAENGVLTVSWAPPDEEEGDHETAVIFRIGEYEVRTESVYELLFRHPVLVFRSVDMSQFPLVRVYYRIEDEETGEPIPDLPAEYFTIMESVEGGAYVAREVRAAHPLDQEESLAVSLVADKSGSIELDDMTKIKSVMSGFVDSLQYDVGDVAEVLSFDDIVRQMCAFTDQRAYLVNGINNMYPEGMTALYDALSTALTHAAREHGAGCVIGFTDGADNVSSTTPEEVIRQAKEYGIPIYIIGVGYNVEEDTLRYIADETGGRYWFIDDLYDLTEIFSGIYREEKSVYVLEYEADETSRRYAPRTLEVSLRGADLRAKNTAGFTPPMISDPVVHPGSFRYELFREDVSWEEANRRCEEMGGHLVTITSADEMDLVVLMAEKEDISTVWLGGYTSYDAAGHVFGHWVTGEPFTYEKWSRGEPSRQDLDGTQEYYLMLWDVPSLGGWTWNDQRNDPVADGYYKGKIGFVCEWEE